VTGGGGGGGGGEGGRGGGGGFVLQNAKGDLIDYRVSASDRDRGGGGGGGGFVLQNARPKPLLMTRHVTIGQSNAIVRELFL